MEFDVGPKTAKMPKLGNRMNIKKKQDQAETNKNIAEAENPDN